MVIAAADDDGESENMNMTTVPERSRSLHNFSSLPFFNVHWGRQKQLRCVKDSSSSAAADHDFPTSSSLNHHRRRTSPDSLKRKSTSTATAAAVFDGDGGIEAMREKLMLEIRAEVQQMKTAILSDTGKRVDDADAAVAGASTPWNLRSRRTVCKERVTTSDDGENVGAGEKPINVPTEENTADVGPRPKFSASLSKKEIEQDFLAILGTRPARRPKKRPRYVQRQIDALCPGYWLSEITADMYKVNENAEAGKR